MQTNSNKTTQEELTYYALTAESNAKLLLQVSVPTSHLHL